MASKQQSSGSGGRRRKISDDHRGFTLVELLVVIVIIGMLMGLIIPAVTGARAKARQLQCVNYQHELGLALAQYEMSKKHLPGYGNRIGTSANTEGLSWVIMVFEELGHGDQWKTWRDGTVPIAQKVDPTHANFAAVRIPELICPADFPEKSEIAPLSYVANCGLSDFGLQTSPISADVDALTSLLGGAAQAENAVRDRSYGLFFNHMVKSSDRTRVPIDGIADGAGQTVLLSENIQASSWAPRILNGNPTVFQLDVGMVWWSTNSTVGYAPLLVGDGREINEKSDKKLTPADYTNVDPRDGRVFARPSSNHTGGVVVTFCDGKTVFQSDDIDYSVYRSLLTPNDVKALDNFPIIP